jgi:hypothetical protein
MRHWTGMFIKIVIAQNRLKEPEEKCTLRETVIL